VPPCGLCCAQAISLRLVHFPCGAFSARPLATLYRAHTKNNGSCQWSGLHSVHLCPLGFLRPRGSPRVSKSVCGRVPRRFRFPRFHWQHLVRASSRHSIFRHIRILHPLSVCRFRQAASPEGVLHEALSSASRPGCRCGSTERPHRSSPQFVPRLHFVELACRTDLLHLLSFAAGRSPSVRIVARNCDCFICHRLCGCRDESFCGQLPVLWSCLKLAFRPAVLAAGMHDRRVGPCRYTPPCFHHRHLGLADGHFRRGLCL
jgi:hypothetical protein